MGKGGTEGAKGVADMILIDDNFSTISYAIICGRWSIITLNVHVIWKCG